MSNYVLSKCSEISTPFHLTADDVNAELDTHHVTPRKITKYRLTRGLGGKIAAQYLTYRDELERPTWEHEEELEQHGNHAVQYWAGEPVQVGGGNPNYRHHSVPAATTALARGKGDRHVPSGYLFSVTPERGRGSIHLISLARISISRRLKQVGSCLELLGLWRTRRASVSHTQSRC